MRAVPHNSPTLAWVARAYHPKFPWSWQCRCLPICDVREWESHWWGQSSPPPGSLISQSRPRHSRHSDESRQSPGTDHLPACEGPPVSTVQLYSACTLYTSNITHILTQSVCQEPWDQPDVSYKWHWTLITGHKWFKILFWYFELNRIVVVNWWRILFVAISTVTIIMTL